MHTDCKETCNYAQRIQKGIKHRARTGLERFLSKYKFWEVQKKELEHEELGIGAMTETPGKK